MFKDDHPIQGARSSNEIINTIMLKRTGLCFASLLLLSAQLSPAATAGQARARLDGRPLARVLLIPLDDRPPCLQFTQLIGRIGDAEIKAPPRDLLGRFTEPGKPDRIADWVRAQELRTFDAVIVSMDMLAYGGLVNSRVHRTTLADALHSMELVRWIRTRAPRLPIYGFNVIMRLAPTGDGNNESYREKLARWAEISPESASDGSLREEVSRLEREIPVAALTDYKRARARNFAVNRACVELARSGALDYLILSQDDAKPRGVHVADRERLIAEAQKLGLADKVAVQPGADEVSMLLLARALNKRFVYAPRIAAVYSSDVIRNGVAPYEDRPLHRTVSFHIAATGSREVANARSADIIFFVYGSRFEDGAATGFAEQVSTSVAKGRRVIVADIDVKGDVQGADPRFTEELGKHKVLPRLTGYASWNTAGNTIGTALPHGIIYARSFENIQRYTPARRERIVGAQAKFLLHRLIDDYAYHSLVRKDANRFAREKGLNPSRMSGEEQTLVENFIRERMRPHVDKLWAGFDGQALVDFTLPGRPFWVPRPARFSGYRLELPWGRTFEAEIDFDVETRSVRRESLP